MRTLAVLMTTTSLQKRLPDHALGQGETALREKRRRAAKRD
jgi:hypothetical protein